MNKLNKEKKEKKPTDRTKITENHMLVVSKRENPKNKSNLPSDDDPLTEERRLYFLPAVSEEGLRNSAFIPLFSIVGDYELNPLNEPYFK